MWTEGVRYIGDAVGTCGPREVDEKEVESEDASRSEVLRLSFVLLKGPGWLLQLLRHTYWWQEV